LTKKVISRHPPGLRSPKNAERLLQAIADAGGGNLVARFAILLRDWENRNL